MIFSGIELFSGSLETFSYLVMLHLKLQVVALHFLEVGMYVMYESVSYNNLLLRAAKHVFESIHLLTICLVHLLLESCGITHNGVKPFAESY